MSKIVFAGKSDGDERHFAAVSRAGEMFLWGSGDKSGLLNFPGITPAQECRFLTKQNVTARRQAWVQVEPTPQVVAASCGVGCTVVATTDGLLWRMDYGEYVRMKKTPVGYVRMKMTGLPAGAQIASVSCGINHAAYTLASGEVCTSGFGEYGQLGRGDPDEMKHRVGVNGGGH